MFGGFATTSAFKITPLIVDGQPAKLGQFPYYAYLDIRSFGFGKYISLKIKAKNSSFYFSIK